MPSEQWRVPPVLPEKRLLWSPRPGQSVWPGQCCPSFAARHSETLKVERECWFCRYADFRLKQPVALEVGICCHPVPQLE